MSSTAFQEPTLGLLHAPHTQVPRQPAPPPSRVLHPDVQHLQFCTSPVQPFFPYPWSTSSPYLPYGGIHGFGYGMMPMLLPPYLDMSGYMIPHGQLHLLDYRHLNAPTSTHQIRRSNVQNGVPLGCAMVSSEVQTEPLCHNMDVQGRAASSHTCSESGRGTGCVTPVSASSSCSDTKSVDCPEGTSVLTQNCNTINSTDTGLSGIPKSEILQPETIQIKCSKMPSKILHDKENMKFASHNKTDLLQCSLHSVQTSEDVVLCAYQSLAFRKEKRTVEAEILSYSSKHRVPVCTEIPVVRASPSCQPFKICPKPSRAVINQSIKEKKLMHGNGNKNERSSNNNNPFKILRLPFEIQNPNQPSQHEASIWSLESLIPYVPSSEWMIKNGFSTPQNPLSPSDISKQNRVPVKTKIQSGSSPKPHDCPSQLEASIWSVESLMPYVPSQEWMDKNGFLTPPKSLSPHIKSSGVLSEPSRSSIDGVSLKRNMQTGASDRYEGSPYHPSTSWLADLGNVYYYSKLPVVKEKLNVSEGQLQKSHAISLESSPLKNVNKTRNYRSEIDFSNQKHCLSHTCMCETKGNLRLGGSAKICENGNKHPFPSCRSDRRRNHRSPSFLDSLGSQREKIANVKTFDKRATEDHDPKKMKSSPLERCRYVLETEAREQTGFCEDCQSLLDSPAQDKSDVEWRIWEKSEEDRIINPKKRFLQRLNEFTQKGNARFMASSGSCALPMNSLKAH